MVGQSIGIDLSINGAHDCTVLNGTGQLVQRFSFDSSSAGMQKLAQHVGGTDPSHGAPVVVMEPTGLAWFLPCLYLRAHHPDVKVVRIKTSKVAALRRYLELRELEDLEAAIARRYREVAPEDRLGTLKGLGPVTAPTLLAAVGTPQRFHSQAAFRGWTGVVPHARQSADSDAKGLTMTKAGPRRVKLALYQAAEIARRWDPQLAKIYYDQMVHRGKPHYKAVGAVMSHLASRIHAVLTEQRDYILRDVDGREVTAREARTIIQTKYRVPAEIRAERRTSRRRKPDVSTGAHRGSGKRSSRRSSTSSQMHSTRSQVLDQTGGLAITH